MLNRGNYRGTVFHSPADYEDFIKVLDDARRKFEVDLYAFCLMPNHFHVVARFDEPAQLSGMMQLWLTTHVRRHHLRHNTAGNGHIWQDRFKSFEIQQDAHLLNVLRYVLLNPVRARLADSPWAWRWSSLWFDAMMAAWPVEPGAGIQEFLGVPLDEEDAADVRSSIRRGIPYGDAAWQQEAARAAGLESKFNRVGRPKPVRPFLEPALF